MGGEREQGGTVEGRSRGERPGKRKGGGRAGMETQV